MFTQETIERIRATVFRQVRLDYDFAAEVSEGPGLEISMTGGRADIRVCSLPALARAFFLIAQSVQRGEDDFYINQQRRFESVGACVDMSRGGVMHVPAIKRYIDHIACLGMNTLMLYTEDTYEIPEYPYFGYLRGRYTTDELREADTYAQSMGVELVPSIQTLAHLAQFLQWEPNARLRDTDHCLMIDEPETYELIDRMLAALRSCFSSRRIHIGMDEAHGVGLGRYFERYGLADRFDLLNRHLSRVVELCEKYGFYPMMWSDMFFRLGSKTGAYYDPEASIPQRVIDALPNVEMTYWDYYNQDESVYEFMLAEHERMGRPVVFAGGVWTWSGFLPQVDLTYATMMPALRSCARHNVRTVLATQWGDDGTETNYFLAMNQLAIFSEFCWRGPDCTIEEIERTGSFLTGLLTETYRALGEFYEGAVDRRTGKGLIYCDLLYPLVSERSDIGERIEAYERARLTLAAQSDREDVQYAETLFTIASVKASVMRDIRRLYESGGRDALRAIATESIPALIELYRRLVDVHRSQWESTFKRNGWEEMALRYGAVIGRMEDAAHALVRYADGELSTLCEMDEKPLPVARKDGMQFYNVYVTPSFGW